MNEVQLKLDEDGNGSFLIMDGEEKLAEMVISTSGNILTAHDTEVSAKAEGQGLAKKLLSAMVEYARNNNLKVYPRCPFVHAQFKRHPDQYADIWKKTM
jgi:predicted GNAT family acetyltransferase